MKSVIDAFVQKSGPALLALVLILFLLIRPLINASDQFLQDYLRFHEIDVSLASMVAFVLVLFIGFSIFAIKVIPALQKSDADYALRLQGVFGGIAMDSSGSPIPVGLSEARAVSVTNKILQAIGQRASNLGFDSVRANLFMLKITDSSPNHWCAELVPDLRFTYSMDWGVHSKEDQIRIPFGTGSSGMSFKYGRAVFCYKKPDGTWQHMARDLSANTYLKEQFGKVHKDLKWILSMPVPSRLSPRYMLKGILNVDCLGKEWDAKKTELLKQLAIDVSVAAALIGLLNKSSGHLHGLENEEMDKSSQESEAHKAGDDEVLKRIELDSQDFDPRDCPPPSADFLSILASKPGLSGLSKLAPNDISEYFKQQLSL